MKRQFSSIWYPTNPLQRKALSVTVRTPACEEKHVTVVLTIAAYGDMLPILIISPGKTDRTIKDLTVPDNLCIVTQEMVWIEVRLMMVWHEKI